MRAMRVYVTLLCLCTPLLLLLLLLLPIAGTWSNGLPANASVSGVQCQACLTGQTSDTGATSPRQCCEWPDNTALQLKTVTYSSCYSNGQGSRYFALNCLLAAHTQQLTVQKQLQLRCVDACYLCCASPACRLPCRHVRHGL
jgi:hypothetical protein